MTFAGVERVVTAITPFTNISTFQRQPFLYLHSCIYDMNVFTHLYIHFQNDITGIIHFHLK